MTTDENRPGVYAARPPRAGRDAQHGIPYSAPPPATAAVSRATAIRGPRRRTPGAHAAAFALRHFGIRVVAH